MAEQSVERAFIRILDQDHSPQRFPLAKLLHAVQRVVGSDLESWRVFRAWGQGWKTARLTDALEAIDVADDLEITTATLTDLDDDPDEWFFDVIIRTNDGSLSFGIFDSGWMFVEGPRDEVIEIGTEFEHVVEHDPSEAPAVIRGENGSMDTGRDDRRPKG